MQHTNELWITRLFDYGLAGPANWLLSAIGVAHDPKHPWSDWMVCEILVVIFVLVFFGYMRRKLSVDKPSALQHILELTYEFIHGQTLEAAGQAGMKYLPFFGTIFFLVLFLNLIGLIPGFDSPTMYAMVPLGFAVTTFIFYNALGIKKHKFAYIKQFAGPLPALVVLMLPIEIFSHFARILSLTARLFANMVAGEQVYLTFIMLTKIIVPAIFVGLHLFVSLLQAYIFMLLAMVYVGGALSEEH